MRSAKGQFIVEGMIAMGIIVSSVLGIFSLAVSALRTSSVVTDQFIAANLAAEGLEVTKNILDSNVVRGAAWNHDFSESKCFEVQYNAADIGNDLKPCDDEERAFEKTRFLNIDNNNLYSYDSGEPTIFKRWIVITPISIYKIRATATVAWRDPRHPTTLSSSTIATDFVGWRAE